MDIVLVTVDAWRATHASFHPDTPEDLTPSIDKLAEGGTVFTQAIGHGPATPYAFPALFSSTLPLDYGGYESIRPDRPLVSERLAATGRRCVGVHGNPWLGEKYGYARGYDAYRDVGEFSLPLFDRLREHLVRGFGLDHPVYRLAQSVYRYVQTPLRSLGSGDDEIEAATRALSATSGDTFLWVHFLTPHAPYTPPDRHRRALGVGPVEGSATKLVTRAQREPESLTSREREVVRGLYGAAVRHADERVGRLLEHVGDDALVVVTADHGEALFEHGQVGHEPALHDELIHVPLLVRPPVDAPPDRSTVDAQVRHVDVAPTLLEYAGVDPPATYRGRSLRPAIEGDRLEDRVAISEVASTATNPGEIDPSALRVAVRLPDRKVIRATDGTVRGFDLASDPEELSAITDPDGAEWEPLRGVLSDRLGEIDVGESAGVQRDETVKTRLRELGYLE